jgi:hypothetical protein
MRFARYQKKREIDTIAPIPQHHQWVFGPATREAQSTDNRERAKRNNPTREAQNPIPSSPP